MRISISRIRSILVRFVFLSSRLCFRTESAEIGPIS